MPGFGSIDELITAIKKIGKQGDDINFRQLPDGFSGNYKELTGRNLNAKELDFLNGLRRVEADPSLKNVDDYVKRADAFAKGEFNFTSTANGPSVGTRRVVGNGGDGPAFRFGDLDAEPNTNAAASDLTGSKNVEEVANSPAAKEAARTIRLNSGDANLVDGVRFDEAKGEFVDADGYRRIIPAGKQFEIIDGNVYMTDAPKVNTNQAVATGTDGVGYADITPGDNLSVANSNVNSPNGTGVDPTVGVSNTPNVGDEVNPNIRNNVDDPNTNVNNDADDLNTNNPDNGVDNLNDTPPPPPPPPPSSQIGLHVSRTDILKAMDTNVEWFNKSGIKLAADLFPATGTFRRFYTKKYQLADEIVTSTNAITDLKKIPNWDSNSKTVDDISSHTGKIKGAEHQLQDLTLFNTGLETKVSILREPVLLGAYGLGGYAAYEHTTSEKGLYNSVRENLTDFMALWKDIGDTADNKARTKSMIEKIGGEAEMKLAGTDMIFQNANFHKDVLESESTRNDYENKRMNVLKDLTTGIWSSVGYDEERLKIELKRVYDAIPNSREYLEDAVLKDSMDISSIFYKPENFSKIMNLDSLPEGEEPSPGMKMVQKYGLINTMYVFPALTIEDYEKTVKNDAVQALVDKKASLDASVDGAKHNTISTLETREGLKNRIIDLDADIHAGKEEKIQSQTGQKQFDKKSSAASNNLNANDLPTNPGMPKLLPVGSNEKERK